jgi:hypothetical protein
LKGGLLNHLLFNCSRRRFGWRGRDWRRLLFDIVLSLFRSGNEWESDFRYVRDSGFGCGASPIHLRKHHVQRHHRNKNQSYDRSNSGQSKSLGVAAQILRKHRCLRNKGVMVGDIPGFRRL